MPRTKVLSDQERAFCRAYVRTGSCVRAAREAEYENAESFGFKLVKRPLIAGEIARLRAEVVVVLAAERPACASESEVREHVTWLMRFARSETTQLRAAMVLARLLGMTGEFNAPGGQGGESAPSASQRGLGAMSRAELEAEGLGIAVRLKLLPGGDGRR